MADPAAPLVHTVFMLVRTTPAWLAPAPEGRFAFLGERIRPILRAHPAVRLRFYDAEVYTARFSDVLAWETDDLREYQAVVE